MSILKDFQFRGVTYKVACVEAYPQHPSWFSFVDEQSVRDSMWTVNAGECVIDIGAAYGSYSLAALSQGAARCFAWSPQGEPDCPSESALLQESLAANGWTDKCRVYNDGLYDRNGWLDTMTQAFYEEEPENRNSATISVRTVDSWYESDFKPHFERDQFPGIWLKLDVEGAEVQVLQSGARMISELRPKVLVENHNFKRASLEQEVRTLMLSFGYDEVSTVPYHSVSHSLYVPK